MITLGNLLGNNIYSGIADHLLLRTHQRFAMSWVCQKKKLRDKKVFWFEQVVISDSIMNIFSFLYNQIKNSLYDFLVSLSIVKL
jgi:hypothetical protein